MDRDAAPFTSIRRACDLMSGTLRSSGNAASSGNASEKAKRRRLASERDVRSARVLVCENAPELERSVHPAVCDLGYDATLCATLADALRETSVQPFDLVMVVLPGADDDRLSLLHLLRRALPNIPLVVVSAEGSLDLRARVQPLRPYYFAVLPLGDDELRAVLKGALARKAART
jgi:DNA-binding response OmpR family regulator